MSGMTSSGNRSCWHRYFGRIILAVVTAIVGAVLGPVITQKLQAKSSASTTTPSTAASSIATSSTVSPTSSIFPQATRQAVFSAVYDQPHGGHGICQWDFISAADRSFAFDYDHSGKLDHMVMYRPGTGCVHIIKNQDGAFTTVYPFNEQWCQGIGGYDLAHPADLAFAFDYDHSGKLDYLVFYRPGHGAMFILKNDNGVFMAVYAQGEAEAGIGGYDLLSPLDRAFAFDFDHSGKMDYMALYRPGSSIFVILKNSQGEFTDAFLSVSGLAGYDLAYIGDVAFAFDYDHSGKNDHVILYRPGRGAFWIAKNQGGTFVAVYQQGDMGVGIGGYGFASADDKVFPFDFEESGRQDYLVFYRPGSGVLEIMQHTDGSDFVPIYGLQNQGTGIAGFPLNSEVDLAYAYDYTSTGRNDHMVLYEPGAGSIYIVERVT